MVRLTTVVAVVVIGAGRSSGIAASAPSVDMVHVYDGPAASTTPLASIAAASAFAVGSPTTVVRWSASDVCRVVATEEAGGGIPKSAQGVRDYVGSHEGEAPSGYVGGRTFENREGNLPSTDAEGNPITYKEYDVNPYQKGVNRGLERIVVGSNGSAYYTNDYHHTFTPFP